MVLQSALQFIAAVRGDPELVRSIQELGSGTTLDRLVTLGRTRGFGFTADELRKAYKLDWAMRMAAGSSESPRQRICGFDPSLQLGIDLTRRFKP